jgi:hypothetical protein
VRSAEAQAEGCVLSLIEARATITKPGPLPDRSLGPFLVERGGEAFREEWAAYVADALQALRLLPGETKLKLSSLRAVSDCDPDAPGARTNRMRLAYLHLALNFATNWGKPRAQNPLGP